MSDVNYGEAVYGDSNGFVKRPNAANANWKQTTGSNIYRILPPFGLLAKSNKPGNFMQYEALHWGFVTSTGKKRVFRCPFRRNYRTKMVEVACPMCDKIAAQLKLKNDLEGRLKTEGKTKDQIKAATKHLSDWLSNYNLEKRYFLNVMRPDGQIGRLKIPVTSKIELDNEIKRLRESGICKDPVGKDGVFFDFQRSDPPGGRTSYKVSVATEQVETTEYGTVSRPKKHVLSDEVIARMKGEAWDLAAQYIELDPHKVQMLVDSEGDASVVDSVFGMPKKTENVPEDDTSTDYEDMAPPPDDEPDAGFNSGQSAAEQALIAQLAALRAKNTPPSQRANTGAAKSSSISDDELNAMLSKI